LHNTLPTLEAVVQHLHILGKEELLNCFDERRDIDGEEYVRVTESQVLRQLFENMGQQMHRRDDFAMRRKAMQMLYVMDPMDHVEAFRSIGRMPNFFNV
jgi:hypothetical protein